MLLACREVREFTEGVSRKAFLADRKLQRAVCMDLEIIGEAARTISAEFKEAHPQVPWPDVVGLRHRIVHEYFRVDPYLVWEIVEQDIPALRGVLEPLVPPP